jgi:hypothetical protein
MSAEVTRKQLTVMFEVEDEPEMKGTIVRAVFTPDRMEVNYRNFPDRGWGIHAIHIYGDDGHAAFGAGASYSLTHAPDWAQTEALKHLPKD